MPHQFQSGFPLDTIEPNSQSNHTIGQITRLGRTPPFDVNLVGKQLEVCWPYKKDGKTVKIWASGRVKVVADDLKDTKSPRHKKLDPSSPAGAVLFAMGVGC